MKRVLVIGGGSAGKRHASCLRAMGLEVTLVSRYAPPESADRLVARLSEVSLDSFDYGVIASSADRHLDEAWKLAKAGMPMLVEKPLSTQSAGVREWIEFCQNQGLYVRVGYNLRFHPGLLALKSTLGSANLGRLLWINAYVGQDVRCWRKGRDYRTTVSIRQETGGGCLLELSHEVDFLMWLAGPAKSIAARIHRLGDLEGDAENFAELHFEFVEGVRASLHQNMVQYPFRRFCEAIFTEGTVRWEFFGHTVTVFHPEPDAPEVVWNDPTYQLMSSYQLELAAFIKGMNGQSGHLATMSEGLRVLELIDAARRSSEAGGLAQNLSS